MTQTAPEIQLQIGQLTSLGREALVPGDTSRSMLFLHDAVSQDLAAGLCEGMALQLLHAQPPGQAQVLLYEAVPSQRFSQLKRLYAETGKTFGEQLFNAQACTRLLAELNERAHHRYTRLAAAQAPDIHHYNAGAHRAETLVYLVISGLEQHGDGLPLQTLCNLCQQGPAVGIVPILLQAEVAEYNEEPLEHKRKALHAFLGDVLPQSFGFDLRRNAMTPLNQPPALWRLFYKFQIAVGLDLASRRQWAESLLARANAAQAESPHRDFLLIPIGMEGPKRACFCLGEASDAYHALLGGATRSGKSTLLNNLILSACETFSPDELRLWLFDYREGVEFHIFDGLAHVEALHVDNNDKRHAMEAFAGFEALISQRATLFKQCDPPVARLADYNRLAPKPLPRCLMIVDEAQSLFEDREARPHAKRLLKEISRKGAAFGLHLLLSTQSYQNVDLEQDVKAQFRLRIGLRLSSSMECRALMGRDNDAPLNLPRFGAVYNNHHGEAGDNRIVALDALAPEELQRRLAQLKQRYPKTVVVTPMITTPTPGTAGDPRPVGADDWADWDRSLS